MGSILKNLKSPDEVKQLSMEELAELASANGFGPAKRGGCGGPRFGRGGGCGGGCASAVNSGAPGAGGQATCGSPSCPNAQAAQQ